MPVGPDPELGKTLLEQKPNKGNIGNAIFLMVLGFPMMLVIVAPNAPFEVRLGFFALGALVCGFAGIMLWRNWMHVFLQEFGVREFRQRRGRSIAYADVDEIIYSSLRIFAHGSYIRTGQKLALRSSHMPGPPIVCTLLFKEPDGRAPAEARTALTVARDNVSSSLAERLLQRVQRDEAVDWSPAVRIRTRGLEFVDHRGAVEIVEWRSIRRFERVIGKLRVWVGDEAHPRAEINDSLANFYPAYALALRLKGQQPQ